MTTSQANIKKVEANPIFAKMKEEKERKEKGSPIFLINLKY